MAAPAAGPGCRREGRRASQAAAVAEESPWAAAAGDTPWTAAAEGTVAAGRAAAGCSPAAGCTDAAGAVAGSLAEAEQEAAEAAVGTRCLGLEIGEKLNNEKTKFNQQFVTHKARPRSSSSWL